MQSYNTVYPRFPESVGPVLLDSDGTNVKPTLRVQVDITIIQRWVLNSMPNVSARTPPVSGWRRRNASVLTLPRHGTEALRVSADCPKGLSERSRSVRSTTLTGAC